MSRTIIYSDLLLSAPSLNLRCPLCPETPPFERVDLFRKHLAESKAHLVATLPFQFKRRFFTFRPFFPDLEIRA